MRTAGAALLLESTSPLLSGGAVGVTVLRQQGLFCAQKELSTASKLTQTLIQA